MDAHLFLDYAEAVLATVEADPGHPHAPAMCRSAISRAYYARYLLARELLGSLGIDVRNRAVTHTNLPFALQNSGVLTLERLGNQLSALRGHRTRADYDLLARDPETVSHARVCVTLARSTVQVLGIILAGKLAPPLDAELVRDTILDWARANGQPFSEAP
jgi:uncharacterized protein (UPF0332 family)